MTNPLDEHIDSFQITMDAIKIARSSTATTK